MRVGRRLVRQQHHLHPTNRTGESYQGVQHMDPGPGHPATWRFLERISPFCGRPSDLVAEMRFKVNDSTEFTALDQPQKLAHRRKKAFVGADAEHHTSLAAGGDSALRVGLCQGQRFLTEYRFSRLCR